MELLQLSHDGGRGEAVGDLLQGVPRRGREPGGRLAGGRPLLRRGDHALRGACELLRHVAPLARLLSRGRASRGLRPRWRLRGGPRGRPRWPRPRDRARVDRDHALAPAHPADDQRAHRSLQRPRVERPGLRLQPHSDRNRERRSSAPLVHALEHRGDRGDGSGSRGPHDRSLPVRGRGDALPDLRVGSEFPVRDRERVLRRTDAAKLHRYRKDEHDASVEVPSRLRARGLRLAGELGGPVDLHRDERLSGEVQGEPPAERGATSRARSARSYSAAAARRRR